LSMLSPEFLHRLATTRANNIIGGCRRFPEGAA
jgi:hypothetical protein